MPNAIKYNTNAETLALKKGNFWIGNGAVGKGPTSSTGYYNGVAIPSGGYVIYSYNASLPGNTAYFTAANDSQLISYTNGIAGQSYTTVNQCFTYYYSQTDKVCVSQDYPSNFPYIVLDNLILYLDAGVTLSYPGNGTTWTDVNGLGPKNNGILYNGTTFNSNENGGTIQFDGIDDYLQANVNTTALDGDPSFTVDMFVKRVLGTNIGGNYGFWGIGGAGQGNSVQGWTPEANLIHLDVYDSTRLATSYYYPENQFVHVCWTKNGIGQETSNVKCYINGTEVSLTKTRTATRPNQFNTSTNGIGICLGRINADSTNFQCPIKIGAFRVYTRALSQTEITQNYNAQKSRFGL
jgi:hypothetical protein